jgi:hypothetical protein
MSINTLLRPSSTRYDINGNQGVEVLRDYRHAARIFTDSNFRLTPKYNFLFYVEFDFNPLITNISNRAAQELGMIVKSVTLPKYTIDNKTHNAYNRKNLVQNRISYDPVSITFHDDQADNVRSFWYDYYSFFFRDSDYADVTYTGVHKYQSRPSFDWGYSPRPTVGYNNSYSNQPYQYIQSIRIYSLYQKNFSEYTLVNPLITTFKHGDHVNGEAGLMEHQMTVNFETVKYRTGYVTDNNVGGFVDLHYDTTPSPIAPLGGTNLVDNGMGGAMPAPDGITDLAGIAPILSTNNNLFTVNPFGTGSFFTAGGIAIGATGPGFGGGFAIPGLGSLTAGVSSAAITGQQVQAATAALAGSAASTLAGGLVQGITKGLGPQGTAIVSLAAAAIANPSAALATVQNMAIKFALGAATSVVNNLTATAAGWLTNQTASLISSGLGSLNTAFAFGDFGGIAPTFTSSVTNLVGSIFTPGFLSGD